MRITRSHVIDFVLALIVALMLFVLFRRGI